MAAHPPSEPPLISGYLAQRAQTARRRAEEVRATLQPQRKPIADFPDAQPPFDPPPPPPPKPPHKTAAEHARKAAKNRSRETEKHKPEREIALRTGAVMPVGPLHADDGSTGLDDDAVIAVFCRNSKGDPELLDLARPRLPRVLSAILAGAQIAGNGGDKDRTRLFRMLGLSWADPPRIGDRRGDGGVSLAQLADRLSRAQARVGGRTSATLTQSLTLHAADDGRSDVLARLSVEQARYPTEDDDTE